MEKDDKMKKESGMMRQARVRAMRAVRMGAIRVSAMKAKVNPLLSLLAMLSLPALLSLLAMLSLMSPPVSAQGPVAFTDFYGTVYIDGQPAPAHTEVVASDQEGRPCGRFVVQKTGLFGFLSCLDYPPASSALPVMRPGQQVLFTVDGKTAVAVGNVSWQPGTQRRLKLVLEAHADRKGGRGQPRQENPSHTPSFPFWAIALSLLVFAGVVFFITRVSRKKS